MTTPEPADHGTYATYYRHLAGGSQPCQPCRDAAARYERGRQLDILNGVDRLVPKLGAVRRIRALMALGWPRRELARRAGYTGDALAGILNGRRQTILRATHELIVELYDQLSMTPGPSDRTRAIALEKGWDPPLAWEGIDIDAPTALPDHGADSARSHDDVDEVLVNRVLNGDTALAAGATNAERHLIVAAWPQTGRSINDLARATGWKPERYLTPTLKENTAA